MRDRLKGLKKGDSVVFAIEPMSNMSRGKVLGLDNITEWTYDAEVVSITKKYITVKTRGGREIKFDVNLNYAQKVTRGGADYRLYRDLEEVKNVTEYKELWYKLSSYFRDVYNDNRTDLDTLREVANLLNIIKK